MKSLNLTYKGSLGKTHLLKINYVKDELMKEQIKQQMQAVADSQLFAKDGEQLYVQTVSAKYITTTEEVIPNKEDFNLPV